MESENKWCDMCNPENKLEDCTLIRNIDGYRVGLFKYKTKFIDIDAEDCYGIEIAYCPWCGRKL